MTGADEPKGDVGMAGRAAAIAALGLAAAGAFLVRGDGVGSLAAAVLLFVAALALAAVALGGVPYGPEAEGRLDLSTRLALGLLGGFLGAVLAAVGQWALETLGIPGRLAVELPEAGAMGAPVLRLLQGAAWGLVLGVLLPWVPGRGTLARGAAFSLVPSLYVLLVVFPTDLDAGLFGLELGALAFVFVLLLNALWGIVAAWTLGWGERTDLAPLWAPLGE